MKEKHEHKFTKRIKRRVNISHYGATMQNPRPEGTLVGFDYLLLWKCETCPVTQAYNLERQI